MGTEKRKNKHKGFIDQTVLEILNDLNGYYKQGKQLRGSDFSKGTDLKGQDLFSLQRRINVYERSKGLNELKREVYKDDTARNTEEFSI